MRALAGFVLLLAALMFGAAEFYLAPLDREALVVSASRYFNPAAPPADETKRPQHRRTFSPASPDFGEVAHALNREAAAGEEKAAAETSAPALALDRLAPRPEWSTVVTMDSDGLAGRNGLTPGDDAKLYKLALELQRELKRVGCYGGYLNGHWGSGSKNAMGEFVRRVNAGLPFDRPDYALLNLVRGHSGLVCGAECLPGEVVARDGQCLRSTILARRSPDAVETAEAVPAPVPARRPSSPLPGRMAVGAPPPPVSSGAAPGESAAPAAESATGYLDPLAARAQSDPAAFAEPSAIPRDPSLAISRPRAERPRSASRGDRGETRRSRRTGGVNSRLPPNRRYVPPPNQFGLLR